MIPSSFWLLPHHSFIASKHLSLGVNFWPAAQIFHHHLGTAAEGHAGGVNCDRETAAKDIVEASLAVAVADASNLHWTGMYAQQSVHEALYITSAQCLDKKLYQ